MKLLKERQNIYVLYMYYLLKTHIVINWWHHYSHSVRAFRSHLLACVYGGLHCVGWKKATQYN